MCLSKTARSGWRSVINSQRNSRFWLSVKSGFIVAAGSSGITRLESIASEVSAGLTRTCFTLSKTPTNSNSMARIRLSAFPQLGSWCTGTRVRTPRDVFRTTPGFSALKMRPRVVFRPNTTRGITRGSPEPSRNEKGFTGVRCPSRSSGESFDYAPTRATSFWTRLRAAEPQWRLPKNWDVSGWAPNFPVNMSSMFDVA